ncbi:hypothetical protein LCGC14_1322120 [marine sediment metagenome]|uniref:CDP-alcohol phosphatidyltransferase n=1 Tax=marine sediment metagenome TaxID=412755 RepID=A0A0F9NLI8_9ZZZZ
MNITYAEVKKRAPKSRDTWFRKLIGDPVAIPLTYLLARYTEVTPVALTKATIIWGLGAAIAFAIGALPLGIFFHYLRFLFDAMDGKLSRIKQEDDTYRGALDFLGDGIVDTLVVIGLAIHGDKTLLTLFLIWMSISFLIHRSTSLSYRLMQQSNIKSKEFVSPEMEKIYGNSRIIALYYKLTRKTEKWGINPIPSAAESSVLIFIVGPLVWSLTNSIQWMYLFVSIGIILSLPVTIGAGVIAYTLAKSGDKN